MSERVLVSGAAGFVGAHVVERLLTVGYTVRGTVRDPTKAEHLRALPGASERLELAPADLLEPDAFHPHVAGVDYVIHTASPYVLNARDPQRQLVDPAVRGTLSVLEAAATNPRIKRVVLTSSMAAVTDEPDGRVLTEMDWNDRSSLTRNPYYFSKAEAERAAWRFAREAKPAWNLIAINPFLVIGPAHTQALNASNQVIADLVRGRYPGVLALEWGFVDVRDVAEAHVRALTAPDAQGRYICAAETRSMRQVAEAVRRSGFEGANLPKLMLDSGPGTVMARLMSHTQKPGVGSYLRTHLGKTPRFDDSKIRRDLGLAFRDVDQSILDTLHDLRRWGHA
ncbi:MAG TPA: aldehyde reductase [Caulobacteraceae bacterium]|jgi:dihydroflavonol-4-reductase